MALGLFKGREEINFRCACAASRARGSPDPFSIYSVDGHGMRGKFFFFQKFLGVPRGTPRARVTVAPSVFQVSRDTELTI